MGTSLWWLLIANSGLLIAYFALLASFAETCLVGLLFNVQIGCSPLELFGLFLPSLCGVFMAFMAVGPQVRPASKSSWRLDCCRVLLPDEASLRHERCYITSGRDGVPWDAHPLVGPIGLFE